MTPAPLRSSWLRAALAVLVGAVVSVAPAAGQQRPDSTRVEPDAPEGDTLDVESSLAANDSAAVDTVYYNLPRVERVRATGWGPNAWEWSHEELTSEGAITLADLVARVPGVVTLLAGDYGAPASFTAFGLGGGRIRIIRDGFEVVPVEGGTADLARVGLAGISWVRLERNPGGLVVRMRSLEYEDHRPYSLVEAGTGDLNTNLFRGTFASPRALGGSAAVSLEREDSRGPRGNEAGNRTGTWLRYQFHRGDAAGLAVDFRRMGTETQAEPYANPVTRTDLSLKGRARFGPIAGEAYWGRTTHKVEDVREAFAGEGGRISQMGVRASWQAGPFSAEGSYRHFGGSEALPTARIDLSAGADSREVGGFSVDLERATWPDATTSAQRVEAWTRPLLGLSLFGSWESGTAGARSGPVTTPLVDDSTATAADSASAPLPLVRFSDRTATRVGARWGWRGFTLAGARLRIEADSLLPLGLEADRGGPVTPGGTREGWEAWARIPTPLAGLSVEGSYQTWDEDWSYMPKRIYQGAFVYHRAFLETRNFEWWWSVGVRGHDPMTVRIMEGEPGEGDPPEITLASVPFYQNWYARMEARIVTVHLFLGWENFTIRRNLQDFPGRMLPMTRAVYGLRWTMWN